MIITQAKVLQNHFPEIAHALRIYAHRLVRETARDIAYQSRASMRMSKSGAQYNIRGASHTASAPGEPPAILSGFLYGDISVDLPEHHLAYVYTVDPKAPWLEFGTRKMAPRPFFTPVANDNFLVLINKWQKLESILLISAT